MKILNFGSLNLDRIYKVEHFVSAGETISAGDYQTFCGGKGLNQSVALARAGAEVYHLGAVGLDGLPLMEQLQAAGADCSYVAQTAGESGHAIIQVTPAGQNCIIVWGGANRTMSLSDVEKAIAAFAKGDLLLLQNETSRVADGIRLAKKQGMRVALNPSPITEKLLQAPLQLVDILIMNEVEAAAIAQAEGEPKELLRCMRKQFPDTLLLMTLGGDGVCCLEGNVFYRHPSYRVPVVDTTAAGDTFCGYFLSGIAEGLPLPEILRRASVAGALAVSKQGAAPSIPTGEAVAQAELEPKE